MACWTSCDGEHPAGERGEERVAPGLLSSVSQRGRQTAASDEGQSSHLPRALCPLAARSERPHPQGQLAPVELAGDSDLLAHFWRIGVFEMAC